MSEESSYEIRSHRRLGKYKRSHSEPRETIEEIPAVDIIPLSLTIMKAWKAHFERKCSENTKNPDRQKTKEKSKSENIDKKKKERNEASDGKNKSPKKERMKTKLIELRPLSSKPTTITAALGVLTEITGSPTNSPHTDKKNDAGSKRTSLNSSIEMPVSLPSVPKSYMIMKKASDDDEGGSDKNRDEEKKKHSSSDRREKALDRDSHTHRLKDDVKKYNDAKKAPEFGNQKVTESRAADKKINDAPGNNNGSDKKKESSSHRPEKSLYRSPLKARPHHDVEKFKDAKKVQKEYKVYSIDKNSTSSSNRPEKSRPHDRATDSDRQKRDVERYEKDAKKKDSETRSNDKKNNNADPKEDMRKKKENESKDSQSSSTPRFRTSTPILPKSYVIPKKGSAGGKASSSNNNHSSIRANPPARKRHSSHTDDSPSKKRAHFQDVDDDSSDENENTFSLKKVNEFVSQVAESKITNGFFYDKWYVIREKALNEKYKSLDRLHRATKNIYDVLIENNSNGTPEWLAGRWLKFMWELKFDKIKDSYNSMDELDRSLALKKKIKDLEGTLHMYLRKKRRF